MNSAWLVNCIAPFCTDFSNKNVPSTTCERSQLIIYTLTSEYLLHITYKFYTFFWQLQSYEIAGTLSWRNKFISLKNVQILWFVFMNSTEKFVVHIFWQTHLQKSILRKADISSVPSSNWKYLKYRRIFGQETIFFKLLTKDSW